MKGEVLKASLFSFDTGFSLLQGTGQAWISFGELEMVLQQSAM